MIRIYVRRIFSKAPPDSFTKHLIIQSYLIILALINKLLHIFPFHFWKRLVCRFANISLGHGAAICNGVRFLAIGRCQIGDRTVINRDCLLDNREPLYIGSDVSIAVGVKIFTQGHDIDSELFSISRGHVKISDHVCIFANALIMPGVELGKGCVVYPGAVVTKSFDDFMVIGGNPAKFIKMRKVIPGYKLNSDFWFN